MDITPNPNNLNSSIISNKDLFVLLITHLEYIKSLRNNIYIELTVSQKAYLIHKRDKLTNKIEYLKSKLSPEEVLALTLNNLI